MCVESVELDPVVFDIARDHFAFALGANNRVVIGDALHHLQRTAGDDSAAAASCVAAPGSESSLPELPKKRHVVLVDVNASDEAGGWAAPPPVSSPTRRTLGDALWFTHSCPPTQVFLSPDTITMYLALLHPGGVLVVNTLCRRPKVYEATLALLRRSFAAIHEVSQPQEVGACCMPIGHDNDTHPQT